MTRLRILCGVVLVLSLAACASVNTEHARIDDLMARYQGQVPGASLLVIQDGEPVVRRGYGYADLEKQVLAGPETNYRLASITKQFVAAGILLLREDGVLELEDTVRRFLPELPKSYAEVTIEQLLTHTSGIVDYEELMDPARETQISDHEVLGLLAGSDKRYFRPGDAYRYSNSAYVLLGLLIERASGDSLPGFLDKRIFQPLEMENSLLFEHDRGPQVPNRAYGYSLLDGKWLRTDQSPTSATRGDGGIYSSIDDLARWDAALYDDRLLSRASRELMFAAHVVVTGEPYQAYYGFGWRITGDTVWHSGETMGFRNVIVRWPSQRLTVILLSNRNAPEPYATALAIGDRFLDKQD